MDDENEKADQRIDMSMIGSLFYLIATRPYIMFAASYLLRFMQSPG